MCSAPVSGILMDQIGLRITKLVGVSLYFIGCLMFAFVRGGTSYLIFPAMIFGAVGAYASVLCNLHVASVFPVWRGMIISGLNGAYESSSVFAFVIAKTSPAFALRDSFILLGCFAFGAGCLVSTFILTQRTTDMRKLAKHATPNASTPEFAEEEEDSVYDREVERLIQYYYPDKKSCFLSEAYTMAYLYFLPGVLRFSLYFSQLDQQLLYSFTHEHEVVNKLLLASSYTSMCAILLSPFTGLVIDYSRKVARQKLESKLAVNNLKPRRIYWYHMCALAPTLFLLATLSFYISCTLYITGQQWVYYTQFVAIVFMGSILPSVTNTFIMTAFPLKYFGTLMGVLSLIGGIFSLVQFGLIQLPIAIGNGFMVVSSVIMFIPPIFLFIGAN
ncbi:hypothetical protein T265_01181 [Opisthorchis viverrini]|uniref:Transporter, major facilitator family protein n=1 Tax=Opisthorchis viverrini TaxID=6198 RepID=A0A075A3P5_OPIVI|nr:hypothetical protein T265_01181 [Opisthorchis viverrini]KER32902.1 hypothetical protein T265_01181 [Opisthorchis viverrini]